MSDTPRRPALPSRAFVQNGYFPGAVDQAPTGDSLGSRGHVGPQRVQSRGASRAVDTLSDAGRTANIHFENDCGVRRRDCCGRFAGKGEGGRRFEMASEQSVGAPNDDIGVETTAGAVPPPGRNPRLREARPRSVPAKPDQGHQPSVARARRRSRRASASPCARATSPSAPIAATRIRWRAAPRWRACSAS